MIEINIALNPYGLDYENLTIGEILIANIGKYDGKDIPKPHRGRYYYMYMFADKRWGIVRHDRSEDIYVLLTRIFSNKHQIHEPTEFKEQYLSLLKRLNPLNWVGFILSVAFNYDYCYNIYIN